MKELGSLGTVTQLYSQDLVSSGRRKILGTTGSHKRCKRREGRIMRILLLAL